MVKVSKIGKNISKQVENTIKENITVAWLINTQSIVQSLGISENLAKKYCKKVLIAYTKKLKKQFRDISVADLSA